MNSDEKARKICIPLYRDIHDDLCGTISMGDIAAIIGNRMYDACIEMHNWTLEQAQQQGALAVSHPDFEPAIRNVALPDLKEEAAKKGEHG